MQIALKLGMDILGIPVIMENYRKICDAAYLAEQNGVHISPARLVFDKQRGCAYSPVTHESPGFLARNLVDDVYEIQQELEVFDESKGWKLDEESVSRLKAIKSRV